MGKTGYKNRIVEYIEGKGGDSVFVPSDFAMLAGRETVKKVLQRLVSDNFLSRPFRGIYYYPRYIESLDELSLPNPGDVAEAIARNHGWTIIPCGDAALNILGVSTQVVASWVYFSDGPYRSYEWDGNRIEFRHRTNREITNLSYKSAMVVQALKALGKDNLTGYAVSKIRTKLSAGDKARLLEETKYVSDWIYEVLELICRDASEESGS